MGLINTILSPVVSHLPENNRLERIWKLAQIDFKKRYYNDRLGIVWALINPLFRIAIYYFVFKMILQTREDNYALFLFSGLLIWMVFAESSKQGMNIIKTKRYLIENIQFQKIDLFISHVLGVFMGFSFNLTVYLIFALIFGIPFSLNILYFLIVIACLFMICVGVSMILATVIIFLKDMVHVWDILLLAGFWTSGIFFRGEAILEKIPVLYYLHPFIVLIMVGRDVLLFDQTPELYEMFYMVFLSVFILLIGIRVFHHYSNKALEKL